ncbi:MAG: hypothetical protein H0A75_01700 [Candidatus Methanofishera endochildressiae]|uniref:Uncharacterized protein n=1 Tax=Candidatus Methanofishera endochildressiae TaxID=2738884 RepID=A0A7Z0MND3_9GAMM|nr:hypothetical protein [Candidatus Methanofishera endochildressiae]
MQAMPVEMKRKYLLIAAFRVTFRNFSVIKKADIQDTRIFKAAITVTTLPYCTSLSPRI